MSLLSVTAAALSHFAPAVPSLSMLLLDTAAGHDVVYQGTMSHQIPSAGKLLCPLIHLFL